jgi:3-deoxy-D-manno-octulosonic-acid transferase
LNVMIYVLYEILLHISLLILLPYFLFKMLFLGKYREGAWERLGLFGKDRLRAVSSGTVVWVHAVSVGEAKAAMPILKALKRLKPETRVLFSTVTATGNAVAEKDGRGLIDALIYMPFDMTWTISCVVKRVRPKAFVTMEKEVWPNLFRVMRKKAIPVIVANGAISDRSFKRYGLFGFFFKGVFGMVSAYCGQTPHDCERATALGVKEGNARVLGNVKFDITAPEGKASLDSLKASIGVDRTKRIIVAGSTHAGEEGLILTAFKRIRADLKDTRLVLAPRHPERFNDAFEKAVSFGFKVHRRSSGPLMEGADVALLDTMGELMSAYSFADIAIIGGTFVEGIGGHNLLEPAYYGVPVLYGPFLGVYKPMADLLEKGGGGARTPDAEALYDALKSLLTDDALRRRSGRFAEEVVRENRGASVRAAKVIEGFLKAHGR